MLNNLPKSLEPFQYTVWTEFTPLAIKHQAINLGQGFPSFSCPDFVKASLTEAANNNENQYVKPVGFPLLTQELAKVYGRKHNRVINGDTEIIVTHGASEALMLCAMGLLDPGDEVVVIDPSFDLYEPQIRIFGGVLRRVSLIPPVDENSPWTIDFDALENAFSPKTRAFFYNTPNNPIGKVFTRDELIRISEILKKWPDVAVVADEVYEHITFDGREHVSICDVEGMWERTLTLSSAGKIFSITGWKTGWAIGGAGLIRKLAFGKVWASYCSNSVCQGAIARSLKIAEEPYLECRDYYEWINNQYIAKREILIRILRETKVIKIQPLLSEGGFFLCARILDGGDYIPDKYKEGASLDFAFCRWITETLKVSAIPCSAFFSQENKHYGEGLVRFALCKGFDDYEKVEKILLG